MSGRTRWGADDWSFGELLRYQSPKGRRSSLVSFVRLKDASRAVIVTRDHGTLRTVPLDQLKRDPQLRPELRADLRVVPIEDPLDTHALEVRYRRHWKRLAAFLCEAESRPVVVAVIAALQSADVVVQLISSETE